MWIDVKRLAVAVGKSPRLIQIKAKNGEIMSRKKDRKSLEIEVESCPAEWQMKISSIESMEYSPIVKHELSPNAMRAIGRKLSPKESLKLEVSTFCKSLGNIPEREMVKAAVVHFGISDSTIRRYLKDVGNNQIISTRKGARQRSWDEEAIQYLKAFYLQLLKERNIDSKQASWNAVQSKAQEKDWRIGSRSSAFRILSDIPKIYVDYARGGNRALDNIIYIKRDWSRLNPADILIGDQHIADFWVLDETSDTPRYFRPTFYVWLDAATRCVAGISVDKNYDSGTVLDALYMAISRFGFFGATYNDNGTSECSAAATAVIDELLILSKGRSNMFDISELYKTSNGTYAVEDENEIIVDTASDVDSWRRKHRRIYAQVKNAKAKPIERFFSTIETKLAQRGIAGHVVTPDCPADQEEKESNVLERQKANGEILTLSEFVMEFVKTISEYENMPHSSLNGLSPMEKLRKCEQAGWKATYPESRIDLDFIFMYRKSVKVRKGRVTVNGIEFIGEDLRALESGELADVGLMLHEGEKVEVRFNPLDMSSAYAVLPNAKENRIRALRAVESIEMLDYEKLEKAMEWKRSCMKTVRDGFKVLAFPEKISRPKLGSKMEKEILSADKAMVISEGEIKGNAIEELVARNVPKRKAVSIRPFFSNSYERFKWCIDRIIANEELSESDSIFCEEYKIGEEYSENREYWETYIKYGGAI